MTSATLTASSASPALALPTGSILSALGTFRWRLAFVAAFCAVVATEVLAQPEVYEYWTLAALASGFFDLYVQSLGYGVMILLALTAAEALLPRVPAVVRPVLVGIAILAGAIAGGVVDIVVEDLGAAYVRTFRFAGDTLRWAATGAVVTAIYLVQRRAAAAASRVHEAALERVALDRQMLEARLQVMRAQIEPHFLFNTLANVKRLYDTDRANGARMLRNLKEYLAVALPQMRETRSTLGREIAHVTAYLNIQQIRMGRRLAFGIDVHESIRGARMPPLMLLTLAENAIKHGLGPSPKGGRIDVRAATEDGRLCVQVADTGQGFAKSAGGGTGLANIRARLKALFGDAASLSLTLNAPRGVIATIVLPYQDAASGDPS